MSWMEGVDAYRSQVAPLRHELQLAVAALRQELQQAVAKLDAKIDQRSSALEALIERRVADLMKWSFVSWVGAVTAIAALAGVLR